MNFEVMTGKFQEDCLSPSIDYAVDTQFRIKLSTLNSTTGDASVASISVSPVQQAPVVEQHHCAGMQLESDLVLFVVDFTSQKLQVAVEITDFVSGNGVQWKTIVHVVADLHGITCRGIQDDHRSVPLVMTTSLLVIESNDRRRQPLVGLWIFFFDVVCNFKPVD